MINYGCKNGLPHDFRTQKQNSRIKVEQCMLCGEKKRWYISKIGKSDNRAYLKAHARDFAQSTGATKELYHRIYKPIKIKL